MTLPEELVKAVRDAPCQRAKRRAAAQAWNGGNVSVVFGDNRCGHAECAVAAVLRALPESEVAVTTIYRALEYGEDRTVGAALAALARLADDA